MWCGPSQVEESKMLAAVSFLPWGGLALIGREKDDVLAIEMLSLSLLQERLLQGAGVTDSPSLCPSGSPSVLKLRLHFLSIALSQ